MEGRTAISGIGGFSGVRTGEMPRGRPIGSRLPRGFQCANCVSSVGFGRASLKLPGEPIQLLVDACSSVPQYVVVPTLGDSQNCSSPM